MAVPMARRDLRGGAGLLVAGEDRGMRRDDAVAAARPHHRDRRRSPLRRAVPCFSSTRRNAWSARMRVKSLTPPLPSVLPITAMTSSAVNWPVADAGLQPGGILHALQLDLRDLNRHSFVLNCSLQAACPGITRRGASSRSPRRDRSSARALRARSRSSPRSVAVAGSSIVNEFRACLRHQHNAVIVARRRRRHLALDHVAQHQLRLALERIAPAAAAGGDARARPGRPAPARRRRGRRGRAARRRGRRSRRTAARPCRR